VVDSIRGADFQTRQLLLALRSGSRAHIAQGLILEATYRATQGDQKRAAALYVRAEQIAGDELTDHLRGLLDGARGFADYFRGDAPRAIERLERGEAVLRRVPGANWELSSAKLFWMFAVRVIGDYALMRRRYQQYTAEAQQRGDRYVESSVRRVCVPMWLADDDPAEAARELDRATWVPETTGYHVQHFHELIARGEIALYTGEPADVERLREGFERLSRSLLLRVMTVRIQLDYLLGRLAIVGEGGIGTAERHARALARADNKVARIWAQLIRAGAAIRAGDRAAATTLLEAAEEASLAAGMKLSTAAVRRRLAELRGDDALLDSASSDMAALGIRAPAKMTGLLIPTGVR
jgi:hypothetical protein